MRAARVVLSRSCNQSCAFCEVADQLGGPPVEATAVREAIDAARSAGFEGVVFTGGEPTLSAHLLKAIAYARGLGLRTGLSTHGRALGDPGPLGRLVAAGLDEVAIALHGAHPSTHVALVGGDPVAHAQTVAGLRAVAASIPTTLRTVLTAVNAEEIPALVALAADVGARFDLRRLRRVGAAAERDPLDLDPQAALEAWKAAWRACDAAGVPFSWSDFDGLGLLDAPTPTEPALLDAPARAQLEAGLVDRALLAGLRLPDAGARAWLEALLRVPGEEVGHVAATRRLPVLDLPAALGGARADDGLRPLPAWRGASTFAVVVDASADDVTARSTLPGLHHALLARGARSALLSLFSAPTDPRALLPPTGAPGGLRRLSGLLRPSDDRPTHPLAPDVDVAAAEARWLSRLELPDVEVVVVGSFRAAGLLRPRLPAAARVVILDDGVLTGFDGPVGPHDVVRSPAPAAARAYVVAGVPLRQVHWRPAPFHLPHLPTVDPMTSRTVVLAGGDAIDEALVAAAWRADLDLDLVRLDRQTPDAEATLRCVAQARAVWLPVRPRLSASVARAASLALAAGRPLLASETPLTADHARPGDSHLLRHDARAHRAALERLDLDVGHAPDGARRAVAGTDALADELIHGAPPVRVVGVFPRRGPWWCW